MRVQLSYTVEVPDDTDRTALAEEVGAAAAEHGTLIEQGQSSSATEFTVYGTVKGRPGERWEETVLAENAEEAEAKAQEAAPEGTEYTVAVVMPGGPPAGPRSVGE